MMTPALSGMHLLIIDDDADFRRVVVAQLRSAGCAASTAASYEEGIRVLEGDDSINAVLLDHPTVSSRVVGVVDTLRRARPSAAIVGNSGSDRRREFALAGVSRYLQKPWRLDDLARVLSTRVEACVTCGRRLPLRLPVPGEQGESWVCASWGARYFALLDECAPEELRPYATRADAVAPQRSAGP
jgi:CheY-like chemotaxis protein